jgi:hypothetical protein
VTRIARATFIWLLVAGTAGAQLSASVGTDRAASSGTLPRWNAGAQLSGLTPAVGGFRLVSVAEYARDPWSAHEVGLHTASLSYRRGFNGGWLGYKTEVGTGPSMVVGSWRQIGSRATIAIASTIRRAAVGGSGPRFWTETRMDSIYTDTTGWSKFPVERVFGDSGSAGTRRAWAETEARIGWTVGRIALDGVVGWRPALDTTRHAAWARGFATVGVARNVALSLGAGMTARQVPYAKSTGRFALVGLRLAPVALVRPNETPEITPSAAAFTVAPGAHGEYVVRVRLPRARAVEISGDFNGWKPIPLERGTGDTWVVSLSLKPGAYRMNLRIDGEQWVPPPGTPAVDDEFNGRVGLVVVR